MNKTVGLAELVRESLTPLKGKIDLALIYGSIATSRERSSSDVDLMILGNATLADAKIPELSDDRRFATAYNAVLQLTKIVIACEGYRVVGLGHHQTTFQALELALSPSVVSQRKQTQTC